MSSATDAGDQAAAPPRHRRLPRRLIVAAWLPVGIAALMFVLTLGIARPVDKGDSPIVGALARPIDLETLDGQRVALADMQGSPIVINFWASWCRPCRDEAPLLVAADGRYRSQGLRVLGIVYEDTPDNARAFTRQYGQTYPGLLDPDGRTAIDYGVLGIPETFFVDRSGMVRSRQVGALTAAELDRQIEMILR